MAKTSAYSMAQVNAVIDGLAVIGLWDGDDAIVVTEGSNIGTGIVGAAGDSIFSQSADKSATIVIKLMHTSPTHRQLLQRLAAQRAGRLVGFPFNMIDKISNEGGTADQCFISVAPVDQKGKNAAQREWTLWTGDYERNITNA